MIEPPVKTDSIWEVMMLVTLATAVALNVMDQLTLNVPNVQTKMIIWLVDNVFLLLQHATLHA
jgi:hypothetical protein